MLARIRRFLGGYDTVAPRNNNGIVKIGRVTVWNCSKRYYAEGDAVPHEPRGNSTYSVQTLEGWYANVDSGRLTGWTKRKPIHKVWK